MVVGIFACELWAESFRWPLPLETGRGLAECGEDLVEGRTWGD